ncbi:MAG: replicative DNA helicase [Planctomycetes bacterium]|nr:replicative DNA helicase [Planctomycetota bacterium]
MIDCEAAQGVFDVVTTDDFYSNRHKKIFDAANYIYTQHQSLDQVLLWEELKKRGDEEKIGGVDYLDELEDFMPAAGNAESYARIVREKGVLRGLHETCVSIVSKIYESNEGSQVIVDSAETAILKVAEGNYTGNEFTPIKDELKEIFSQIESEVDTGLQTGYPDLDQMVIGLRPAQFVVVAGRPSMGKTTFCLNIVQKICEAPADGSQPKSVAIFSLEMARQELATNLLCMSAGVDSTRVRSRSVSTEETKLLVTAAGHLHDKKIFIDDSAGLTVLSLRAKARRLHKKQKLDLIIVDYLQLMDGAGGESRQQEISTISRGLKGIARDLGLPVVAISQLSRKVEDRDNKRPRMSDLRESGAIEQDADLIMMLHRPEYYMDKDSEDTDKVKAKPAI